ncbi:MAG: 50S ribosomal protein L24 [Candidatus Tectomicrobia bacterium]|nr:50S ribosomal protein L24 [Candidatus Tectomicrobia bacterium]
MRIKKNDIVEVISGKEKGKRGKVLVISPQEQRVTIERINMVKRHTKPSQQSRGGIIEKEGKLHYSKVMLVCGKCDSPVKSSAKILENGEKVRICKKCGEQLEFR